MNIAITTNDTNIIEFYKNQINDLTENSGFDLVATEDLTLTSDNPTGLLSLGVKCAPTFNSGYYLYPRSSIFKTPIRMANSVGIIDMNYRGEIKAPVDFNYILSNSDSYTIKKGTKLFQLCHPSLAPVKYNLVDETELSLTTRNTNGFGSTGQTI
jgi:dUTP pyrophosphatase